MELSEMGLTRIEHWDTRSFNEFLLARASTPFAWGENDCALFVAEGIEAMTGVDIAADFRGRYHTEAEAFDLIRELTGGETVEAAAEWCAQKFGLPAWEFPLAAQRGDMVMVEDADRVISGLVHLNGRHIVSVGEAGLKRLPITAVVMAWHV
jgi:hypothetical protein